MSFDKPYMYQGKAYFSLETLAYEAEVSLMALRRNMEKYPDRSFDSIVQTIRNNRKKFTIDYEGNTFTSIASLARYVNVHQVSLRNALKKNPDLTTEEVVALVQSRRKKVKNMQSLLTIKLEPNKNYRSLNCIGMARDLREQYNLGELEKLDGTITVDISLKATTISYNFFNTMFGDSVRKLGSSAFRNKYSFITGNRNSKLIEDYIDRCVFEQP